MDWEFVTSDDNPMGRHAQALGEMVLAIEKRDGAATPEALVEEARRQKGHPAHTLIWGATEKEAAIRYRISRAAEIIRHVKVVLRVDGKPPVSTRLMYRGSERGTYNNVHHVMSNEELRAQTIGQAAEDAEQYKNRYRFLRETAEIIEAIDSFVAKTKTKKVKK